ncbi:hypothetical protein V2J09_023164 [Rumex salicifolius]
MSLKQEFNHKSLEAILTSNGVLALPKEGLMGLLSSTILPNQGLPSEPFLVLDIGTLVRLMNRWARAFESIRPYYAVKCNPDPTLISVLAALGANFDCATKFEMELVLSLGVSPNRIVFANPCKMDSHILYAKSVGVNLTTYDSTYEVEKIRRLHPKCGLLLRIKVGDDGAKIPLGSKYGALAFEVDTLLQAAKSARLTVLGVSFHVGSGSNNPGDYEGAIALAKSTFDAAARLGLPDFEILDIGGGFTSGPPFEAAAKAVNSAIKLHFKDEPSLTVIAEPGRYFAETAVTLAANVIGKRVRDTLKQYWIGDGVYGTLSCILWDDAKVNPIPFAPVSSPGNPTCKGKRRYPSTVFGPTCDALDKVLDDYGLPDLEVGDWLVFNNMGAYTTASGSNFNGFMMSDISTRLVYTDVAGFTTLV